MKVVKKMLKIILGLILLLALVVGGYVAYVYLSYHRIADDQKLEVKNQTTAPLKTKEPYKIMTFNIGYGAYPPDYSFFMDGGKYSRAYDQKTVIENLQGIVDAVKEVDPALALFQEVDVDGDRSQHVNEVAALRKGLTDYSSVFAQNYDSAYLFYPLTQPIGKASSGLVSLAKAELQGSQRYSLPIETNFNKFFDLDRAFSVTHVAVENQRTLALINIHLSAFTKDRSIQAAQLNKLFGKMEEEYAAGHYVIVGGDYNHDVIGNAPEVFGTKKERETWTHPFPVADIPKEFQLVQGELGEKQIPSVRAMDQPYTKGQSYVSLVDGFLISDNVKMQDINVQDLGFKNSDHNPVVMEFVLQ